MQTVVFNKGGPRMVNLYRPTNNLAIAINGPGMLFEKLQFMTNRTALEGATYDFYIKLSNNLQAIIACGKEPARKAAITIETHRLGAELNIELGPTSMYQSIMVIETRDGTSFQKTIDNALGNPDHAFCTQESIIAILVAVRASGHHEHHSSAVADIRCNANGISIRDHGGKQ